MTTNSGRPRRKCVSVSFVGDDDVIGHIVDTNQKNAGKAIGGTVSQVQFTV